MGITHLATRPLLEMSSGEVKRTLIARALVHDPQTLLFDEPGNTLDIAGQLELRQIMRELARAGLGLLLVTHHVRKLFRKLIASFFCNTEVCSPMDPKDVVLSSEQFSGFFEVPVRVHSRRRLFSPPCLTNGVPADVGGFTPPSDRSDAEPAYLFAIPSAIGARDRHLEQSRAGTP